MSRSAKDLKKASEPMQGEFKLSDYRNPSGSVLCPRRADASFRSLDMLRARSEHESSFGSLLPGRSHSASALMPMSTMVQAPWLKNKNQNQTKRENEHEHEHELQHATGNTEYVSTQISASQEIGQEGAAWTYSALPVFDTDTLLPCLVDHCYQAPCGGDVALPQLVEQLSSALQAMSDAGTVDYKICTASKQVLGRVFSPLPVPCSQNEQKQSQSRPKAASNVPFLLSPDPPCFGSGMVEWSIALFRNKNVASEQEQLVVVDINRLSGNAFLFCEFETRLVEQLDLRHFVVPGMTIGSAGTATAADEMEAKIDADTMALELELENETDADMDLDALSGVAVGSSPRALGMPRMQRSNSGGGAGGGGMGAAMSLEFVDCLSAAEKTAMMDDLVLVTTDLKGTFREVFRESACQLREYLNDADLAEHVLQKHSVQLIEKWLNVTLNVFDALLIRDLLCSVGSLLRFKDNNQNKIKNKNNKDLDVNWASVIAHITQLKERWSPALENTEKNSTLQLVCGMPISCVPSQQITKLCNQCLNALEAN